MEPTKHQSEEENNPVKAKRLKTSQDSCQPERSPIQEDDCPESSSVLAKEESNVWPSKIGFIREGRSDSPNPSCVSMKSDQSMDATNSFTKNDPSTGDDILKTSELSSEEFENQVLFLVKKEMRKINKVLSPDYLSYFKEEDEDKSDPSVQEGALKIALHVLKKRNQAHLADTLLIRLAPVCQQTLKSKLINKYKIVNEGISEHGKSTLLNEIYTELYITEDRTREESTEHEMRQIEILSRRPRTQNTLIKYNNIFHPLDENKPVRTVLTKGVAGIGKTVSVQKFILDWAEGKANQDIHFVFPIPFRELNLMKEKTLSLVKLLDCSFTEFNKLFSGEYDNYKLVFIFDGLDECRFPLNFKSNERIWDVRQSASVDVLLTNLFQGSLLPSALIWITSRPAAANQIPPECVDQVTEVQGFNDQQKDEYIRRRTSDHNLAERIVAHMKASPSLYVMCHIPFFCWIAATSLEKTLTSDEIPRTLTQMFAHFMVFQTLQWSQKYQDAYETDSHHIRQRLLLLGKLAFQQLQRGNPIFYEEDLRECGIDLKEAAMCSGVYNQIFREESVLYLRKVFCFVHLSVQEFLASLYVFVSFVNNTENMLEQEGAKSSTEKTLHDLLKCAVDQALESKNGHLDLFLRFLLGLSLESNQTLIRDFLTQTGSGSHGKEDTVEYVKEKIRQNPSPEKSINLFHCLNELNDHSLESEVQTYLTNRDYRCLSGLSLSQTQWSALVFVLLTSKEKLDTFDLSKYDRSEQCMLGLLPVIKASRKAILSTCKISKGSCSNLALALSCRTSNLRELDLSSNTLQDSGVELLSAGLGNPNCKLERLGLSLCELTKKSGAILASTLASNSHLRALDLSKNDLQDSGIMELSAGLKNLRCQLEILNLSECSITEASCAALASALLSNPSHLRELDLCENKPGDAGVKALAPVLKNPECKLEKLRLCFCGITDQGCADLASALSSNPCHIRELDLSRNKLGNSVVKHLSGLLENPRCRLEKLVLWKCSFNEEECTALALALRSNPSPLKELDLGHSYPGESGIKQLAVLLEDPQCKLEKLELDNCSISEEGCAVLVSALMSNPSHLKELDLSKNRPGDEGVKLISALLENQQCRLEKLILHNCSIREDGCAALASALNSNASSLLRELDLSKNQLGCQAMRELSARQQNPLCALKKLTIWASDI